MRRRRRRRMRMMMMMMRRRRRRRRRMRMMMMMMRRRRRRRMKMMMRMMRRRKRMIMTKRKNESCHCKVCLWLNANFQDPEQIVPMNARSMERKYRTINVWFIKQVISLCIKKKYRILSNYRTYPYKRTVKQFRKSSDYSRLLYKAICCRYPLELHRLVDAIQMSTHNIRVYKRNQKAKKKSTKKHRTCIFW